MPDAPTHLALMADACAVIMVGLEAAPGAEPIGANFPGETRHGEEGQPASDAASARVVQGLTAAVAVVLNTFTITTIRSSRLANIRSGHDRVAHDTGC